MKVFKVELNKAVHRCKGRELGVAKWIHMTPAIQKALDASKVVHTYWWDVGKVFHFVDIRRVLWWVREGVDGRCFLRIPVKWPFCVLPAGTDWNLDPLSVINTSGGQGVIRCSERR